MSKVITLSGARMGEPVAIESTSAWKPQTWLVVAGVGAVVGLYAVSLKSTKASNLLLGVIGGVGAAASFMSLVLMQE